jgi:uncharacterized protein YjdB/proteasome lid subunit RPN8/RPN11
MSEICQLVVFSNKAYNAIIRESFDKDPVETGGILLGHILNNGVWIVMEVLPPGINSIFQYAYFEYDEAFVNYLAQSVANQYKQPLDLLGLWHRHPGSMDVFSTTDDGTNTTFARQNPAGVISGLVNIDPSFRITMYHLNRTMGRSMGRPNYNVVDVEVGDDIIPEEYFELRYFDGDSSNLHPTVSQRQRAVRPRQVVTDSDISEKSENPSENDDVNNLDIQRIISNQLPHSEKHEDATPKAVNDFFSIWRDSKKRWTYLLLAVVAIILTVSTFRTCKERIHSIFNSDDTEKIENTDNPSLSVDSLFLKVGDESVLIDVVNLPKDAKVQWTTNNPKVISVKKGNVSPISAGSAKVSAYIGKNCIGSCKVVVEDTHPKSSTSEDGEVLENRHEAEKEDVVLTEPSGNVKVGDSAQLPITVTGKPKISYSSSDSTVVTVSQKGVVTGVKKGNAIISVSWNNDRSLIYKVTVK